MTPKTPSLSADIRSIMAEARMNPYRSRYWPGTGSRPRRRIKIWCLASLCVLAASAAFCVPAREAFPTALGTAGMVWNLFWLRALLLFLTARRVRAFALSQASPAILQQIALTPLRPGDLVLGWAMTGFMRSLPLGLMIYAALVPFLVRPHATGILIACAEGVQWVLLQLLASFVVANQTLKYAQRREAVASAWIATFITYPLAFFLRAMLVMLPMLGALLIMQSWIVPESPNMPPGMPFMARPIFRIFELIAQNAYWFGWATGTAFWGGVPLAALYEVRRQLTIASQYRDEMRGYLELPPGQTGR